MTNQTFGASTYLTLRCSLTNRWLENPPKFGWKSLGGKMGDFLVGDFLVNCCWNTFSFRPFWHVCFLTPRRSKKEITHNQLKLNPFLRACHASKDRFHHMIHATHHCFEESAQLQNLKTTHGSTKEVKQSWSPKNAQHLGKKFLRFGAMNMPYFDECCIYQSYMVYLIF